MKTRLSDRDLDWIARAHEEIGASSIPGYRRSRGFAVKSRKTCVGYVSRKHSTLHELFLVRTLG
jgi:hypothetical protein